MTTEPASDLAAPIATTEAPEASEPAVPLVVELQGTLVPTNLLIESLFVLAKRSLWRLLLVPVWLARGRRCLERQLARAAMPDVSTLPYRRDLLAHLEAEKRRGTRLVLVTAADRALAEAIARHLGLFDLVLASDDATTLTGEHRRDRLVAEFGADGFDYVGSGRSASPIWSAARRAVVVGAPDRLAARIAERAPVARVFADDRPGPGLYLTALRPHQWLKNALVLMPLLATHRIYDLDLTWRALLVLVAFSLCASSAYLLNDLLDLPSDRHHPRKRQRAFASGRLPVGHGLALAPLLLGAGLALGALLDPLLLGVLALYYVLTLAYSLRLKDLAILDLLALAGLYTLRVMAGSVAFGIPPSAWLLALCGFLFFSLAMLKRYAELVAMSAVDGAQAHARAYLLEDRELLAALGGASGYLSVLVLALYITSDGAHDLYLRYQLIWLVCGLLLYWISYMWLMAHRGRMHDDPLVFALRDRVSQIVIALMAAILLAAT
jgi:4-hydroxybenzoate polyprenyltransferase/phosphoserine phosphatase